MLYTIATAGHIDHGKSSLVRALTGMDPDRLPEEKSREMTIELGFAWFSLPDGSEVAIVDVPGHERFVDAMITGVGSIDMVMFVVAADDGWMPQSQEHLEILDLLGTERGMLVITKTDMADADWLQLVKDDVSEKVSGTFLDGAPMLTFSAVDNSGLDDIRATISSTLEKITTRSHPDLPRLYADRVFSMAGHGTVVTGTMRDGMFSVGDEVRIIPGNLTARVKSIQTHKKKRDESQAGSRVALNLSGVNHNDLSRGSAITRTKLYDGASSIAVRVTISPNSGIDLTHNRMVKLMIGTAKVNARAFVFKDDRLKPGVSGICEFHFEERVLVRIGDRFIIRLPTPDILVGGGIVIDTDCTRHSRSDKKSRAYYERIDVDNIESLIETQVSWLTGVKAQDILHSSNLSRTDVEAALANMLDSGILTKAGDMFCQTQQFDTHSQKFVDRVSKFHEQYPARRGIARAELISRSNLDPDVSDAVIGKLIDDDILSASGALVHLPDHLPKLKPEQESLRGDIIAMFESDPKNPPSRKQAEGKSFAMKDILNFMIDGGELVELPGGLLLQGAEFERLKADMIARIEQNGKIAVSEIREMFGFSRKYGVPILEKLDSMGITKRVGDHRVLAG